MMTPVRREMTMMVIVMIFSQYSIARMLLLLLLPNTGIITNTGNVMCVNGSSNGEGSWCREMLLKKPVQPSVRCCWYRTV